jgi:hypothetical protein
MVKTALFIAALALASCGSAEQESPLKLTLIVQSAAPIDSYAVRVFGAAVKCGDVLANPTRFELGGSAACSADELDTATNCVIAYDVFSATSGTDRVSNIPAGQRAVFVEGLSGSSAVARGCAAVSVTAGAAASASVTLQ